MKIIKTIRHFFLKILKKIKRFFLKIKFLVKAEYLRKRMNAGKELFGEYGLLINLANYHPHYYKTIKKYNDGFNQKRCQNKSHINIGFVVYTSSMWNVDELYGLLKKDARFTATIIIAHLQNADIHASEIEYNNTFNYFQSLGYSVKKAIDISPQEFDIIFYLSPYPMAEKTINLDKLPLNVLVLHTSYSFMLAGNMKKLNLWMYHLSFRYYTDSEYYKTLIEKNAYYTGNAKYLGFPKIDQYYNAVANKQSDKKIIIYAPHHSVSYKKYKSATFENNYREILALAKKYSDQTFWIYKPHPLLKSNSVKGGVFTCVEEYNNYEQEWRNLENAEVVNTGDYFSVFKSSDAMITDSISFLAEYQFTHKPLLLLESGQEEYNDFGKSIVSILYKCSGKDIQSIEKFLNSIIENQDQMFEARLKYFKENLNYRIDDKSANFRIYQDILGFCNK